MVLLRDASNEGEQLFTQWLKDELQLVTGMKKQRHHLEMIIDTLRQIHCRLTASSELTARRLQSMMPYSSFLPGMLKIQQTWRQKDTAAYQVRAMRCYRAMVVTSFQSHMQAVKCYEPTLLNAMNRFSATYLSNKNQHIADVISCYQALMSTTQSFDVSVLCVRLQRCIDNGLFSQHRPCKAGMYESYHASKNELSEMLGVIKTNSSFFVSGLMASGGETLSRTSMNASD